MTTDRSEQSGPEVVAYHFGEEPLITLSSHEQAVEALNAEANKWAERAMHQQDAHHAAILRAESAEARLARVAGVLADLRGRLTPAADFLADQIAAAIAPQEVR